MYSHGQFDGRFDGQDRRQAANASCGIGTALGKKTAKEKNRVPWYAGVAKGAARFNDRLAQGYLIFEEGQEKTNRRKTRRGAIIQLNRGEHEEEE